MGRQQGYPSRLPDLLGGECLFSLSSYRTGLEAASPSPWRACDGNLGIRCQGRRAEGDRDRQPGDSEYQPNLFVDAFTWQKGRIGSVLSTKITHGFQLDHQDVEGKGVQAIRLFGRGTASEWQNWYKNRIGCSLPVGWRKVPAAARLHIPGRAGPGWRKGGSSMRRAGTRRRFRLSAAAWQLLPGINTTTNNEQNKELDGTIGGYAMPFWGSITRLSPR